MDKKLKMPEYVLYWTNPMQYGILLVGYRTEIIDARMPMPALDSSMPMLSYGASYIENNNAKKVSVRSGRTSTVEKCQPYHLVEYGQKMPELSGKHQTFQK